MLYKTGLIEFVDFYVSNEDVKHPKPHSEIYLKCMVMAGVNPQETVIVEDSYFGRRAAMDSGAHVLGVESPQDVSCHKINGFISSIGNNRSEKWQSDNLVVLVPMAGAGKRFQQAGYTFPKPLIEVHGKPMIQIVVTPKGNVKTAVSETMVSVDGSRWFGDGTGRGSPGLP
jgi:hypothetical protein